MNIGIGGAIFLWALMLWPLIVGIAYPAIRKPPVSNLPALAIVCIAVGYGAMVGVGMLINVLEQEVGVSLGLLDIAIPLLTPVVTTHLILIIALANSQKGE